MTKTIRAIISRISVLFIVLAGLSVFSSCSHKKVSFSSEQRKEVESSVRAALSDGTLPDLMATYEEQGNSLGLVAAYRELGKSERNESRFDEALKAHSQGLSIAEQISDTLEIIQALNNIGTDYRRLGVLESATPYHYRAWTISEESSDTSYMAKKNRVVSLNGLGNVYLTTGNYEKAEEVLRLALDGERELGSSLGQAINYANLGSIFEHRGQLDSAWACYRKSMEYNHLAGSTLGISLCHTYFGSLYEKQGQNDKAIAEYRESHRLMSESKDEWHALNSMLALVGLYIKTGSYSAAEDMLQNAEVIADRIHSVEHKATICNLYYKMYSTRGLWKKALDYHVDAAALQDSVVDMSKLNRIQDLSISIEKDRQERLTAEARSRYETERNYRKATLMILVSVIVLLLGLMAMLSYTLRVRQRSHRMLKALSDMRETFFVNITHELRTPLTVILGLSHDIDKYADSPEKTREIGHVIEKHGNNLLSLINQLLDISKIKSAQGEPDWRHGDVSTYVGMIVDGYRDYALDKRIELQYVPKYKGEMDFVPDYVSKILNNLLSNAFKFTPPEGKVVVNFDSSGSEAILSVSDTGVGIPEDCLERIFDPFVQARGDYGHLGTGVGLALVKQIVQSLGGKIHVESKVGEGSKFVISLPIKHGEGKWTLWKGEMPGVSSVMLPNEEDDVIPEDTEAGDMDGTKILVIEDNHDVARYIGSQLSDDYDILYAPNGRYGLERAKEVLPDLIITDLMMPEMDGLELCRQVRSDEQISHIPIIVITAKISESERIKGLEAGADAYLGKPFNGDELRVRVEKLLEQRAALRAKFSDAASQGTEAEVQATDADRRFICKTVDAIYILMEKKELDVNTLAEKMCMSPRQFHRKVLAVTGETPASYLLQVKMRRAKQLLETRPDLSIDDIADRAGFEHYSSFYHAFKKVCGITPSQYRRGGV